MIRPRKSLAISTLIFENIWKDFANQSINFYLIFVCKKIPNNSHTSIPWTWWREGMKGTWSLSLSLLFSGVDLFIFRLTWWMDWILSPPVPKQDHNLELERLIHGTQLPTSTGMVFCLLLTLDYLKENKSGPLVI